MEAHVQEVVEEFYAHLLRFQQPRWLLADAQVLARVKEAQTDYLRRLTEGTFDMAYVANRLAIGRTHARVDITPQWYLGAYSILARLPFPRILEHYRDRPLSGVAAVKALVATMHLLLEYDWPGNVRELENVIERAVILGQGPQILPEDLPAHLRTRMTPVRHKTSAASMPRPTLEALERDYIATVLRETRWHRLQAAHILGIDRRTLYRKIRSYGLQPTTPAGGA